MKTLFFYRDKNDIPKVSLSLMLSTLEPSLAHARIKQFEKGEIEELYVHKSLMEQYRTRLTGDQVEIKFVSEPEWKPSEKKLAEGWAV